ncbi:MAG: hypothetical protein Satyrvirus7_16 [Satyrvirus sp.]|uniref:Uncharacterized protein n=1 Tax=Satyrvirus sp. TaxID=2487771 RepID=A0A3G5ADG3_9VIRU|nr:MAG: hypothetical protein Satyrvirus7_16 [Satyrvirus sp.]
MSLDDMSEFRFCNNAYAPVDKNLSKIIKENNEAELIEIMSNIPDGTKYEFLKFFASRNILNLFLILANNLLPNIDLTYENNILLDIAIINDSVDIVNYLVKNGINVCLNNNMAIKLAAHHNSDIVKLLIENGADIHVDNDFPLKSSIKHGIYNCAKILLEAGANINRLDRNDFMYAIISEDMVKLLANHGANFEILNAVPKYDEYGIQASEKIIDIFCEHGVDHKKLLLLFHSVILNNKKDYMLILADPEN